MNVSMPLEPCFVGFKYAPKRLELLLYLPKGQGRLSPQIILKLGSFPPEIKFSPSFFHVGGYRFFRDSTHTYNPRISCNIYTRRCVYLSYIAVLTTEPKKYSLYCHFSDIQIIVLHKKRRINRRVARIS